MAYRRFEPFCHDPAAQSPEGPQSAAGGFRSPRLGGRGVRLHRDPARSVMVGDRVASDVVGSLTDRVGGGDGLIWMALQFFAVHIVASVGHCAGAALQLLVYGVGVGATDATVPAALVTLRCVKRRIMAGATTAELCVQGSSAGGEVVG